MAITAKITTKGRLTLPKEVRAILNVHAGSVVIFEKVNDKIIIKPAKTLRDYKGVLKTHGRAKRKSILKLEGKVKWEGNLPEMRTSRSLLLRSRHSEQGEESQYFWVVGKKAFLNSRKFTSTRVW